MISENFYDTCTVISELQSPCPHSHLLYWEDWPRILLKNGKQVWNKVNFQFHSVFEWSNLLVWLNFLTIFTRLIQRNDISCALREASICSKYIYKTETDPCIVTGLHCLSYLNIWGWTCFLHCSQLRPSCKMFTPRVLYWWNSVSLNGSLALISTMSFSEDSLCLCRCFFFPLVSFTLSFLSSLKRAVNQVDWHWDCIRTLPLCREFSFCPFMCATVSLQPMALISLSQWSVKSHVQLCVMCVWPEGMWHLIPQTRQQKHRTLKPAVLPELNPVWLCDPSMGGSLYIFDTPTQLTQSICLTHVLTAHKCFTCSICQTHTMLSACQVVVNVWECFKLCCVCVCVSLIVYSLNTVDMILKTFWFKAYILNVKK